MTDYKAEWYLQRNDKLRKALLKIKKIIEDLDLDPNWQSPSVVKP